LFFQRSSSSCPDPVRGKRAAAVNTTVSADDQEVDVYSQSMTVFELDDPISNRHLTHITSFVAVSRADADEVQRLSTHGDLWQNRSTMCLSPTTFGLLMAVLITVLLSSLMTIAAMCIRSSRNAAVASTKY